jgi:hypothetical protein
MIGIKMNRQKITTALESGVHTVLFEKVNGDKRLMQCTLDPTLMPAATKVDALSQTKVREINEEVVVCFDVTAKGWRSFRVENLEQFDGQIIAN